MGKEVSLAARFAHANQARYSQEASRPYPGLIDKKSPLMPLTKTTVAIQLFLARISTVLAHVRRWS